MCIPQYVLNSLADPQEYSTNAVEMQNAIRGGVYVFEGTAAHVFPSQQGSSVPLYRLYGRGPSDHFYTCVQFHLPLLVIQVVHADLLRISADERDRAIASGVYQNEGIAAFVYADQICGSTPLFRLYNGKIGDHFYTGELFGFILLDAKTDNVGLVSEEERIRAGGTGGYTDEGIAAYVL